MGFCHNEYEHEREGADDFRWRGHYGMDRDKQRDRNEDDCAAAYVRGFERAERQDRQRREEEEAEQRRQERIAAKRRDMERQQEDEYLYDEW